MFLIPIFRLKFQDFMLHYNHTTEECFKRCVVNLHQRDLTSEEVSPRPEQPFKWAS